MRFTVQSKIDTPSLKKLKSIFGDPTDINRVIAEKLLAAVREQFRTRGRRFLAQPWHEYSEKTVYAKRIRGPKGRMLEGLMSKITTRFGRTFAAISTDSKIVAYHHFGTRGRKYLIPKQPKEDGFIWYPDPQGRRVKGLPGRWMVARQVGHPGVYRRIIFPNKTITSEIAVSTVRAELKNRIWAILAK